MFLHKSVHQAGMPHRELYMRMEIYPAEPAQDAPGKPLQFLFDFRGNSSENIAGEQIISQVSAIHFEINHFPIPLATVTASVFKIMGIDAPVPAHDFEIKPTSTLEEAHLLP